MSSDDYEAVMFWTDGKVQREMMYAEFEAILDSFVPLPEYAGKEVKAIYVQISQQLKVVAAVYFLISFDADGNADAKWNVPLQQLADDGDAGPNLGGGPIRLTCKSQCSVEWIEKNLWDPSMESDPNDFVILRDVVKRNKLAFKLIEPEVDEDIPAISGGEGGAAPATAMPDMSALGDASDADKKMAVLLIQYLRQQLSQQQGGQSDEQEKKQRLLLAAQKTQFEEELTKLQQEHSEELRQSQEKLKELHAALTEEQKQSEKFKTQLDAHNESAADVQRKFEERLAQSKETGEDELSVLKENFNDEIERRVNAAQIELKEQLSAKEMEIAYARDDITALKEEVEKLHSEKAVLINQAGEEFLNRLKDNEVSFVVYHAGAGHINIALEKIGDYLENPIGFAAKEAEVSEEVYRGWLNHHDNPVCQAHNEAKNEACGKKLKAVVTPSQFVPGRSDRCPLHWTFADEGA